MANIQYIGARYVPKYIGPWDSNITYEPLSIVTDAERNSYISKQTVPAGVQLSNTEYWALSALYNASDVVFNERIEAAEAEIETLDNSFSGLDVRVLELEGFKTAVEEGIYQTSAVYPTPRASVVVNSQAEFAEWVAGFKGRTVSHARIRTAGVYKFAVPDNADWLVLNGCEIHVYIDPAAGDVTLDLAGMTYYNGHFRVIVEGTSTCTITDSMPSGRKAYFEDCSTSFDKCVFRTTYQQIGGWGSITSSEMAAYDSGACVQVTSGKLYMSDCSVTVRTMGSSDAIFALGNNAELLLGGRMSYVHTATEGTVFKGAARAAATVRTLASVYDLDNNTSYNANNRGGFSAFKTSTMYIHYIGSNRSMFYLTATADQNYDRLIVEDYTTFVGP